MKLNENIKIVGEKVTLIPYEAKHVEKYHEWMKDIELQKLTASEPLSLEEEYEMQKSWRIDEDKCTFLIISNDIYNHTNDEIQSLIGDTNLFIKFEDNDDKTKMKVAEAEIMIAEKSVHGKHLGWEAILLMLYYGLSNINVQKFEAKINIDNLKSINMFAKMQFKQISRSEVFKEITFEREVTEDWIKWIKSQLKSFTYDEYR